MPASSVSTSGVRLENYHRTNACQKYGLMTRSKKLGRVSFCIFCGMHVREDGLVLAVNWSKAGLSSAGTAGR
jgi:hypothetical protein